MATVTIPNSDADENPSTFAIAGTGVVGLPAGIGDGLPAGTQLGLDIDGEANGDNSGRSVSLSADGSTVAIGAVWNDGNGDASGHVRIYQFSGGTWTQVGTDIDGEADSDASGWSVSLSADGSTVAIGAPWNDGNGDASGHVRIYQFSGGTWTQVGADINGEAASDESGTSVSLSADGSIVAIGAPLNDGNGANSGHVRIYQFSGGAWTQVGADINGEASLDKFGTIVALSDDGGTVAIGGPLNDGNGPASGHVRIYQFSSGVWTQVGADIDGDGFTQSGESVALSKDGSIVAIGAHLDNANGLYTGNVRIYQFSGGTWTQLGADIDGEAANDRSGTSVTLSEDGSTVAIGAPYNQGNGAESGQVRIYHYGGGVWTQVGADFDGEGAGDRSGSSVALSADGSTVAIGAYRNTGNVSFGDGTQSGHVRIYATGVGSGGIVVAPEIALRGNSVNITNGDSTPSAVDHTDFGSATVTGGMVARTFTITNSGTANLTLTGTPPNYVTLNGTGASHFSVTTQPNSSTVNSSGGTRSFVITFDPSSTGTKTATVSIASNDADENPFTFAITGTGLADLAPEIALSGNGVNIANGDSSPTTSDHTGFGSATVTGGSVSRTFTITNSGTANLTLTGTPPNYVTLSGSGASHFSVTTQPASSTVSSGGGTRTFVVTFDPSSTGTKTATVSIASNDADENPFTFAITGTGLADLAPEIALGGNGVNIVNGDSTPSASDHTHFGNADVTSGSVVRTFTITNTGTANLTLTGTPPNYITLSGAGASHFSVTSQPASSTVSAGGGTQAFVLTFDPSTAGTHTASVTIPNTDSNENPFTFTIAGNGVTGISVGIGDGLPAGTQLGLDIDGEAAGDNSGYSVSLSADGSTVAIGAELNGGNRGHVRIYQFSDGVWTQVGSDIDGEAASDQSGHSVSLSADGSTVAIGAPKNGGNGANSGHVRIYQLSGGAWTQVGADINGEAAGDQSGYSVSLSADGNTVAIGAPINAGDGSGSGHARVYQFSGGTWTQVGGDIDGEAFSDGFGWSVSLNAEGTTVAIGALWNDGNGDASGHTRIYQFSAGVWTQMGADIDGEAAGDGSGYSVSLSADGSTVAIGAPLNSGNGDASGHVRIYQFSAGVWTQVGADIDGEAAGDGSGNSVSLSADGSNAAIGARNNDGNGDASGHTRIYQFNGGAWAQVGADINGEAAGDQSGYSVSLSTDGSTVAIGAIGNDGNGDASGHVRVVATGVGSVAAPEIAVSGNSMDIASGDVTPDAADDTDFGVTSVIGGSAARTFTITNSGTGPLSLTGTPPGYVTFSGVGAGHFSVATQPTSDTVAANGGSDTFTVTFNPDAAGTHTATVSIASNDADENPFTFAITGLALSRGDDTDSDDLNDWAEYRLSVLGFDWQVSQPGLVEALHQGANDADLYTLDQVQGLNVGHPFLQLDLATGLFTLTLSVEKSATLQPGSFLPFPVASPQISVNAEGQVEIQFSVPDDTAFFQVRAE